MSFIQFILDYCHLERFQLANLIQDKLIGISDEANLFISDPFKRDYPELADDLVLGWVEYMAIYRSTRWGQYENEHQKITEKASGLFSVLNSNGKVGSVS